MFKKRRGIKINYEFQGLICFTCLTYTIQPEEVKKKIKSLCAKVGKEHEEALFEFLTKDVSAVSVSINHYVSETVLYELRKKFYESWFDSIDK